MDSSSFCDGKDNTEEKIKVKNTLLKTVILQFEKKQVLLNVRKSKVQLFNTSP